MSSDYEKSFSVRVPPERAFRAFTDPNELEQWFTPKFDADAEEGAPGVKATSTSRSPRSKATSCSAIASGRRIPTRAST